MIRLFRVFVPASTVALAVLEAIVIFAIFSYSIYLWMDTDPYTYMLHDFGLLNVALVSLSFLGGMYFQDLYSDVHVRSKLLLVQQLLMIGGVAFLLQALVGAVAPDLVIPLRIMLYGSAMSIAVLCAGRLVFSRYIITHAVGERLILLGESPLLDDIAQYLESAPELGIRIAGRIQRFEPVSGEETIAASWLEKLGAFGSKRIVVSTLPHLNYEQCSQLLEMRFLGYSVQEAPEAYAKLLSRESLSALSVSRLIYDKEFELSLRTLFFQTLRNWLAAALCLVVLSPIMLIIAGLLRFTGPVFERRVCCGRTGNPFTLYLFRIRPTSDPGRVTWLGRILTRTGFYALPQFFNVLRGQLSVIGPRPQRPEFVAELTRFIPFYPHRFNVLPGMTGWAQIQQRRTPGLHDGIAELEYDLYYIKYISATMDTFLMVQALKNVLLWGGQP